MGNATSQQERSQPPQAQHIQLQNLVQQPPQVQNQQGQNQNEGQQVQNEEQQDQYEEQQAQNEGQAGKPTFNERIRLFFGLHPFFIYFIYLIGFSSIILFIVGIVFQIAGMPNKTCRIIFIVSYGVNGAFFGLGICFSEKLCLDATDHKLRYGYLSLLLVFGIFAGISYCMADYHT